MRESKAIIYTRFSPTQGSDTSESCEYQEDFCRNFCEKQNLFVDASFSDKAISGSAGLDKRPGLSEAIATLKEGDSLVVYHLDRLARDRRLAVMIESFVLGKGCHIISASSGSTTQNQSPEDELNRDIMQAMASYQRKSGAQRTKVAMLRHQEHGRKMSAKCPYGMMDDPDKIGWMIECAPEKKILKLMLALSKDGLTPGMIAKDLTSRCKVARSGKPFNRGVIRHIINRELA